MVTRANADGLRAQGRALGGLTTRVGIGIAAYNVFNDVIGINTDNLTRGTAATAASSRVLTGLGGVLDETRNRMFGFGAGLGSVGIVGGNLAATLGSIVGALSPLALGFLGMRALLGSGAGVGGGAAAARGAAAAGLIGRFALLAGAILLVDEAVKTLTGRSPAQAIGRSLGLTIPGFTVGNAGGSSDGPTSGENLPDDYLVRLVTGRSEAELRADLQGLGRSVTEIIQDSMNDNLRTAGQSGAQAYITAFQARISSALARTIQTVGTSGASLIGPDTRNITPRTTAPDPFANITIHANGSDEVRRIVEEVADERASNPGSGFGPEPPRGFGAGGLL